MFSKSIAGLVLVLIAAGAKAASLSFDMAGYSAQAGSQLSVTVSYDFTDIPSTGGGFNVLYDDSVLEFVSYTVAPGSGAINVGDHATSASPAGMLDSPGNYLNAGIGTFEHALGIYTSGAIGTFVFNVLGAGGDGGCGATLCLTPVPTYPMYSLGQQDITAAVFANGITEANVVPIPAALWLLLSGTAALALWGRKSPEG